MSASRRRLVLFLNIGHAIDHLVMLIFPTVALALTAQFGLSYGEVLALSLGGFIAFGAGALPAGWLGDRWSRHRMMVVFLVGTGLATMACALADGPVSLAVGLTVMGVFGSIYHPVGNAMLVAHGQGMGRTLGVNGLWGNMGLAAAAVLAGGLMQVWGWRAAFVVPGVVSVAAGIAYAIMVRDPGPATTAPARHVMGGRGDMVRLFVVLMASTAVGSLIFNAAVVSMPKIIQERLPQLADSAAGIGGVVSAIYALAAVAQLITGPLIDRYSLRRVLFAVAVVQPPLLLAAAYAWGWSMAAVATAALFAVFGQIPVNEAMVGRYIADSWRSRVYALRYLVSFGASAVAIPLVGTLHAGGGFTALFVTLAGAALAMVAVVLGFPAERPSVEAEAEA